MSVMDPIIVTADCLEGELRLADGITIFDGRVEICIGGEWGMVCDDPWGASEANVVCSQLGFFSAG
jgi:deleted-in-malignant-brain-tumors protein 1